MGNMLDNIYAVQYEAEIGPHSIPMVAIFNSKQISEDKVRKLILSGEAEYSKDIILLPEEKWLRIFREGKPLNSE